MPSTASVTHVATDTLHFPIGLAGFPDARTFAAEPWGGESSPFTLLSCVDGPEVRFVVVSPGVFFPDYQPDIERQACAAVELYEGERPEILVILTLGATPAEATANLLGPLVVNRRVGLAAQAVLAGRRWHPRTPVRSAEAAAR